jgi:hypothetical protein
MSLSSLPWHIVESHVLPRCDIDTRLAFCIPPGRLDPRNHAALETHLAATQPHATDRCVLRQAGRVCIWVAWSENNLCTQHVVYFTGATHLATVITAMNRSGSGAICDDVETAVSVYSFGAAPIANDA